MTTTETVDFLLTQICPIFPFVLLLVFGILSVHLYLKFRDALGPDIPIHGDEDWLIGEKPKNEEKPKNVGVDPYADADEPAYTIGDDGELVEVERE
ncbi:MAG TPA: hypothetical protein VLK33_23040 [Terriglobales bacterium]|nr:hypothetical protein [Terriglobales bacterium]